MNSLLIFFSCLILVKCYLEVSPKLLIPEPCQSCQCDDKIIKFCDINCEDVCQIDAPNFSEKQCFDCLTSCGQKYECPNFCNKCPNNKNNNNHHQDKRGLQDVCNGASNQVKCQSCGSCENGNFHWGVCYTDLKDCGSCKICCPSGKQARAICIHDNRSHANYANCSCD